MLLAGILLMLGKAGGVGILQQISLIVMIPGLILMLLGRAYLKALSFPITYLLLMIPFLEDLLDPLHWPFQLLTAKQGVTLLELIGIPALVEKQFIFLPHITLEVARVCSGINSLISIVAIGIPVAYLNLRTWWGRVTLIFVALVIGVVSNWLRVVLIAVWTYSGNLVLHGPFHIFQGMFAAWVGYAALFAGAWVIAKLEILNFNQFPSVAHTYPKHSTMPQQSMLSPLKGEDELSQDIEQAGLGKPNGISEIDESASSFVRDRSWWIATLILIGLAGYLSIYNRGAVSLKRNFVTFPAFIGEWVGEVADLQEAPFRIVGSDHELLRIYRHGDREIHLYVAYMASQRQAKEIVNWLTAKLHKKSKRIQIQIDSDQSMFVNQARLGDPQNNDQNLFWYYVNDRFIADRYLTKLATTWEALVRGRTNGAFVLLSINTDDIHIEPERAFIRELLPILRMYLP